MWSAVGAGGVSASTANTRGVVMFLGDSNESFAAYEATTATTVLGVHYDRPWTPVFIAHPGAGIRTSDCASLLVCPTFDYWQHRLASVGSRVRPDVIVNDLGVNDAIRPGTINARGYAYYGLKIDHMMRLTPAIPVIWTNTPCTLEPAALVVGCKAVNTALRTAPARCTRP